MPLQKQPYKLPLNQGMKQGSDPKTLTGGLTLVENGVYRKEGEVVKRPGWTSLAKTLASGGDISEADACATYENELLLWSGNHIYTWSPAQEQWYDRGAAYSAAVDTRQIISSTTNYDFADSVYLSGVVLVAYEISSTVRYQMYDYQSGAVLKSDTELSGTALRPRCITISDQLYIIYSNSSNQLKGAIINPITGAVTSTVTIVTDNQNSSCFDAIAVASDTIILAYKTNLGDISVKYLNSSLGARGGSYTDSSSASNISTILRLILLSSARVLIVNMGTETNLQSRLISATGSVGSNIDTGIPKTVSVSVTQISGHMSGTDVTIYAQYTAASEANNFIYKANINPAVGGGTVGHFMRSVGLWTRGWVHGGTGFVGISHKSGLQATYFVVDENKVVVSRHQPGAGGGGTFNNCLANVWSAASGRYEFAILNKTRIIATTDTLQMYNFAGSAAPSGSNLYSPLNVAMTSIDFQDNSNFSTAELGGSMLIAGGVLNMYDGLSVVEHGFFLYPEGVALTSAVGGSVAAGTYLYCVVYEWTDAKGMTHRSAPSVPVSITVVGTVKVLVEIPTLRITQKRSNLGRANVTMAVYRTQAAQSGPFYRVSSITSPTQNDASNDTVTVEDALADGSLPGREYLYTAGGVLDNIAASAAKYIKVWRNRIMLGGLEDGSIQYSKPVSRNSPVEFAAENTLELESDGGAMTAFEILDEKLIVFKNDWPYLTYGDGPDALGLGGIFAPLERIASCDVGTIDQQSTCAIPGAVVFKSAKGYQMLGRDLSSAYIGGDVQDYDALSVSSATLFAKQSEIRITNSDGVTLVFNYEFTRWSVFTNHEAVDGMKWNGSFVHVKDDGSLCIETEETWRDDGVNYDPRLISGWIALADVAGFQRIYRAAIVGDYKSAHTLSLRAAYEYDDTWVDMGSLSLSSDGHNYQFPLKRQKCTAVRFEITAAVTEFVQSGEAISLTAMTLLIGIKPGLSRIKNAQKAPLTTI